MHNQRIITFLGQGLNPWGPRLEGYIHVHIYSNIGDVGPPPSELQNNKKCSNEVVDSFDDLNIPKFLGQIKVTSKLELPRIDHSLNCNIVPKIS